MKSGFKRDAFYTFSAKIILFLLALATSAVIARMLGPEGKGLYTLAILLPTLLITFSELGVGAASVYYIGQNKHPIKEVFGANLIFSGIVSVIALVIGVVLITFFSGSLFPGVPIVYLYLALSIVPFNVFLTFVADILLGLRDFLKYNSSQIIKGIIFLTLVAVLALTISFGVVAAIIAQLFSLAVSSMVLFFMAYKETGGIIFSRDKGLYKDILSYATKDYLGTIATYLHLRIDMWMVNIYLNPLAVGLYSISVALAEQIWIISKSAGTALFPRVASEKDDEKKSNFTPIVTRNILFVTALMALLLLVLGKWLIILFYTEQFVDSVLPFQLLLVGAIAVGGMRILTNDLAGRGKPMINTNIAIIGLVLNIILNIILIPSYGILGASISTLITYTIAFIIKIFVYCKISGNRFKDVVFIKRSDFKYYHTAFLSLWEKATSSFSFIKNGK